MVLQNAATAKIGKHAKTWREFEWLITNCLSKRSTFRKLDLDLKHALTSTDLWNP